MKLLVGVCTFTFTLTCFGCGENCREYVGDPPTVYVIDSQTQQPICPARVEIRDGEYAAVAFVPPACRGRYSFSYRRGSYTVSISADGYQSRTVKMRMYKDDCDVLVVEPEGPRNGLPGYAYTVTVALDPEP